MQSDECQLSISQKMNIIAEEIAVFNSQVTAETMLRQHKQCEFKQTETPGTDIGDYRYDYMILEGKWIQCKTWTIQRAKENRRSRLIREHDLWFISLFSDVFCFFKFSEDDCGIDRSVEVCWQNKQGKLGVEQKNQK